ncbi:MAG: hypothetical protein LBC20_12995 [Planctomycetaceae bacterium]|nr:hypothetical protein [Planctomycetaceae bacterium]
MKRVNRRVPRDYNLLYRKGNVRELPKMRQTLAKVLVNPIVNNAYMFL